MKKTGTQSETVIQFSTGQFNYEIDIGKMKQRKLESYHSVEQRIKRRPLFARFIIFVNHFHLISAQRPKKNMQYVVYIFHNVCIRDFFYLLLQFTPKLLKLVASLVWSLRREQMNKLNLDVQECYFKQLLSNFYLCPVYNIN